MTFILAPDVAPIVKPGVLAFENAGLVDRDPRMDAPMARTEADLRSGHEPAEVVAAVRTMYKRAGIDPTRRRPSSEALLRRIRRGESLPRINAAVDVVNWCSAETQLPYGLYDLDRIEGDIELRLGRTGEEYAGIGKDVVHVAGRLTLVDACGPFGNPTSDSARTMVGTAARKLLCVIFAPRALPDAVHQAALDLTAARMTAYTGAVARHIDVLSQHTGGGSRLS